ATWGLVCPEQGKLGQNYRKTMLCPQKDNQIPFPSGTSGKIRQHQADEPGHAFFYDFNGQYFGGGPSPG
ncbi:hypothetical protein, partial [Thiolapillus sp.]|uniref:hypothetical protein n=1 Tax=Thiolapillus sp. TaxID=2017437 RepID=UPI003AF8511E